MSVIGRLNDGISLTDAEKRMAALARQLEKQYPNENVGTTVEGGGALVLGALGDGGGGAASGSGGCGGGVVVGASSGGGAGGADGGACATSDRRCRGRGTCSRRWHRPP